jgi:hypothetical protein
VIGSQPPRPLFRNRGSKDVIALPLEIALHDQYPDPANLAGRIMYTAKTESYFLSKLWEHRRLLDFKGLSWDHVKILKKVVACCNWNFWIFLDSPYPYRSQKVNPCSQPYGLLPERLGIRRQYHCGYQYRQLSKRRIHAVAITYFYQPLRRGLVLVFLISQPLCEGLYCFFSISRPVRGSLYCSFY